MSKNKKMLKSVALISSSMGNVMKFERKLQELQSELQEIENKKAEILQNEMANRQHTESVLTAKVEQLPAYLGVETYDEVIAQIKHVQRGNQAKVRKTWGRGRRIPDDIKASIRANLNAGGKTGAEIAKEHRVSIPLIQMIKKSMGLVKARHAVAA